MAEMPLPLCGDDQAWAVPHLELQFQGGNWIAKISQLFGHQV